MTEVCNYCGSDLVDVERNGEEWSTADGEVVTIHQTEPDYAVLETPEGERNMCENCYLNRGLLESCPPEVAFEAHYEFALGYEQQNSHEKAKRALEEALKIREAAKAWSALGNVWSSLGHHNTADSCWRRALELDSEDFIARQNLAARSGTDPRPM